MKCEIRKSCNLRNVVYEIGKLSSPVGIILVDMTDVDPVMDESPRKKFWAELKTVFRDVGRAYVSTLEEDISHHVANAPKSAPIVVGTTVRSVFADQGHNTIAKKMQNLGIKRVAMVCIASGTIGVGYVRQLLVDLSPRSDPAVESGVDMIVVVDGHAEENETSILG